MHLRQLMELMHQEDSCSDEEGDGSARLMALAAQVATQGGQLQPMSQQVWSCLVTELLLACTTRDGEATRPLSSESIQHPDAV